MPKFFKDLKLSWRRLNNARKIALIISLIVIGGLAAAATYIYGTYQKVVVTANPPAGSNPSPSPTPDPLRPYAIALLGYGGGTHEGGKLTDSIIVARIDPRAEKIALISLPRDVWVELPTEPDKMTNWKINAAYAIGADDKRYRNKPIQYTGEAGGGELAKHALQQVLGFPIDHFVALSFAGFEKSIDTLGGVTVNVRRTFDDFHYPIEGKEDETCEKTPEDMAALAATLSAQLLEQAYECRYEHLHFDAGKSLMDGATALKYVRSRHSAQDGGDFNRAQRQQSLILAVKERVLSLNFLPKAIPFVTSLTADLTTDINLDKMRELISQSEELRNYEITSIALTDKNVLSVGRSADGQFILMPKAGIGQWREVHTWLLDELNKSATASATASSSAQPR